MKKDNTKEIEKLKERTFNPSEEIIEKYSASEAFCSANFNVLLPNLDHKEHRQRFREVLFNQSMAFFERIDYDLIDNLDLSDFHLPEYNGKGFLLCSYHYGAYKLISSALIKSNRKFFLVINDSVTQDVRNENFENFQLAKKRYNNTAQEKFVHVSAQSKNFIFDTKELIEQGYIMLMFLDGNSGMDGIMKHNSKNMVEISFLNKSIFVKQGLSSLSHAYNVPILPVFSNRKKGSNIVKIESFDLIHPDLTIPRKEYSQEITQQLYRVLEHKVAQEPFEWEGWLYVHKWLNIEKLTPNKTNPSSTKKTEELSFNAKKYAPFVIVKDYFLLDKDTHLTYKINEKYKKVIDGKSKATEEDREYLMVNEILV